MTFENNVLAYGDNLEYLRAMPAESVDLVYLDPPFNSKRNYSATFGADAQVQAFEDTFSWGDDDVKALRQFAKVNKDLGRFLISLGEILPKQGLYSYLVYMASRLQELHRVLKPTGSIYLHVDPTASHYLKLIMDGVFGSERFLADISWERSNPKGKVSRWASCHDVILHYSKSKEYIFEPQYRPLADGGLKPYSKKDERGRYRTGPLDAPDDPNGTRPRYSYTALNGVTYQAPALGWRITWENMRKLDEEGRLAYPSSPNGRLAKKLYLADSKGAAIADVWTDIGPLQSKDPERTGYGTQKPLALLERIVKASSKEGDVVLDPFMGSGTTCVAAAKHGRKFVGIDLTPIAVATAKGRLDEAGVDLSDLEEWGAPKDLASALHLYEQDKRAFDCWAVDLSSGQEY